MEKTNHRLQELLNSYLLESITEAEKSELSDYLSNPIYEGQIKDLISDSFAHQSEGLELEETKQQELLQYIYAQDQNVNNKIIKKKLWPRMIAAASIVLVAGVGFYFYKSNNQVEQQSVYVNDVDPGKNGATLTLANGKKILINDVSAGNIAMQSGVRISKTADGQIVYEITGNNSDKIEYNTLTTTLGEQTQVRLPDGSLVFLNAASSLKFPTSFAKLKERIVEISGEGYFEVAKDKNHPFIVKSTGQQVEVLGTQFNINSYSDEPSIKTTLLEGSVRILQIPTIQKNGPDISANVLKPGQQSQLDYAGKFIITEVNTKEAIAWKDGKFIFKDESLGSIMRKISRWYNVDVIYQDIDPNEPFWGSISKFEKVSKVLEKLELTGGVHFKIEGKTIYVTR